MENDKAKILRNVQIQTDKQVMFNQPDTLVVDKLQRKAAVRDVANLRSGNMKKNEHEKLEKHTTRIERGSRKDVGSKGSSGTSGHLSTLDCDSKLGE